jgi:hypothetical protein
MIFVSPTERIIKVALGHSRVELTFLSNLNAVDLSFLKRER